MAKKGKSSASKPLRLDASDIPAEILEEARARALRKKADMIAQREAGILDEEEFPMIGDKGPPIDAENDQMCEIMLDLAPHSDRLIIDGTIYLHGRTYTVPQRVYDVMRETIHRGWEHQREIDGKDRNVYREKSNVRLSPAAA